MTDDTQAVWDDQLTPILHNDGKGISMCFHLTNEDKQTEVALHLDARYPEVGLPPYDADKLGMLTASTVMEFINLLWPGTFTTIKEMTSGEFKPGSNDTATEG